MAKPAMIFKVITNALPVAKFFFVSSGPSAGLLLQKNGKVCNVDIYDSNATCSRSPRRMRRSGYRDEWEKRSQTSKKGRVCVTQATFDRAALVNGGHAVVMRQRRWWPRSTCRLAAAPGVTTKCIRRVNLAFTARSRCCEAQETLPFHAVLISHSASRLARLESPASRTQPPQSLIMPWSGNLPPVFPSSPT